MKAKFYLVGLLVVCGSILFTACRKNKITGGTVGGSVTLNVAAQHMAHDIDSCWIYIKYDATEAPKLTGYDDSAFAVINGVGRPIVVFMGLTTGNYFLYAKGYDPVYQHRVSGGMVVTADRQKDYYINIPMSEY